MQLKIRKLLAYSSISVVGYFLYTFTTFDCFIIAEGFSLIISYYISISFFFILLTNINISNFRTIDSITDFGVLFYNNVWVGTVLSISLFSIAGLPPLFVFFMKYWFLSSVVLDMEIFFYFFIFLASIISYFYTIRIIKIIFYSEQDSSIVFISKLNYLSSICISAGFFLLFYIDIMSDISGYVTNLFIKAHSVESI